MGVGLVVPVLVALLSLRSGRRGYMPLDQSMIFDGGYRVLHGQVPIRDFVAPAAALPSLLQAGFFALFGTTWLAYCLHAAVVGALFTGLTYGFVRLLGGGVAVSWMWAALSGVMFYPVAGTPLADDHALFFGFAAVVAVLAAGRVGRAGLQAALAAAGPLLLAASYLSKPSAVPFLIPLLGLALLRADRRLRARLLAGMGAGTAAALAVAAVAALATGTPWSAIAESLWAVPSGLGGGRLTMAQDRARDLGDNLLHTPLLTPLALVLVAGWLGWSRWRRRPLGDEARPAPPRWPDLLLPAGLFAAGIAFALVTFRSTWTSWGLLLPAAGGLAAVAVRQLPPHGLAARTLAALLLGCAVQDAARVQLTVTEPRLATLLSPRFVPAAGERVELPRPLAGLRWATDPYNGYPWQDLAGVVRFFARHPGNLWLLGDSSVLYALTGRPSVHPTLWMLPPPTLVPRLARAWGRRWERRLVENLRRERVRYVVLEKPLTQVVRTQMGVSLDNFPCVAAATRGAPAADRRQIGAFTVVEVGPEAWDGALDCLAHPRLAGRGAAGIAAPAAAPGPCTADATTLCIDQLPGDRRFRVQVHYATAQGGGSSGDAAAVPLAGIGVRRGGLFAFFSRDNPELLLKVLDGCALNQRHWVLFSATTNVGFTVTVTDTLGGSARSYTNEDLTVAAPVQDLTAFPCP